jgi:amino acid transporter
MRQSPQNAISQPVRIVVATSVMLTFITWVRAAAIVLNDLGSSAFYAGSIAEQAVGRAAPWFVLGVMLFSFTVRAIYVESCTMFVRGGVYRVVKEALGGTLAKISVSALMFDYVLTGPISGVSAGQYIAGLFNEVLEAADKHGWMPSAVHSIFGGVPHLNINYTAAVIAILVTLYFWWQNIKGIEESSEKALRIMQVTTVMVVLLLGWSFFTLARGHYSLPPLPFPKNLHFSKEALGFLKNDNLPRIFGLFGVLMAFGHAVLAMSGEESLAQVYREIGSPKVKNLKKTALTIAIYSFVFTGISSLLVVMIIPDNLRMTPELKDNLLGALAMFLAGPAWMKLIFRAFVVFVGFLMLSGAVNTAIVGSNGVLNRVSEDGVLTDWFRVPHHKFGTTSRMINLIVGLQILTVIGSRGDVYLLGEAYAFGLMWSFSLLGLAMLVLRFKDRSPREWKVPPNITIGGVEIPIGLASVFLVLFTTTIANMITKSVATISGIIFTAVFYGVFVISERTNRRRLQRSAAEMKEHFQLLHSENVERERVGARPGNLLVTVRDYNALHPLRWTLERTNTADNDVVVMAARLLGAGSGERALENEQIFSDYEQTLFTRVVSVAEHYGKKVSLLVVPARDPWSAIVQTANAMETAAVVAGLSRKMSAEEQAFNLGRAWEAMAPPKRQFVLHVISPDATSQTFRIGPHTPTMKSEDVHLVHRLWLDITRLRGLDKVHHSDIVTLALTRLARDYAGPERDEIMRVLKKGEERRKSSQGPPPATFGGSVGDGQRKTEGEKEEGGPTLPPVVGP